MAEIVSLPVAADELEPYTFARITPTGLDIAVPPDATTNTPPQVDGVILPSAGPIVKGSIANLMVIGIAKVKLAPGQTVSPGDFVAPDANGYAVKDNTYGVYKVIRQAGDYADILLIRY